jgi:putative ABC transport system permease protein
LFQNYFKIAIRNLWKNIGFSLLNIFGLATGLAVCLLIILFVRDELSYDRYNEKADRIYRLQADIYFNGTQANFAVSPDPLGPTLIRDYPQIVQMARFIYPGDISVKKGNQNIQEHGNVYADSTLFQVFTLPMVEGNPNTALREPNSVVIDETTAKKYFGTVHVLGKTLTIDNTAFLKITGVIKDMPRQSHFHFKFIRPKGPNQTQDTWLSNNSYTYVVAQPGFTKSQLQKAVDATINKYLGKEIEVQLHKSLADLEHSGGHFIYHAIPLTDIHLHSNDSYELEANGNESYVYIFSVIAAFILLVASINFMNLSTARSANRAKEVGIRKVVGSLKKQLVLQFLIESVLISFLSLLLAFVIAILLMPLFNQLAGKEMHLGILFSTWIFPIVLGLMLIVGLIAGAYPAFYLSSFQPILVLKGRIAKGFKNSWLSSGLVTFQFIISIVLIIGTIVIYNQLNYIRSKRIGYSREQVVVLHNTYYLDKQINTFRNELLTIPNVLNASVTGDLPTEKNFDNEGWFRDVNFDPTKAVILTNFYVDENYIPTLGMQLKSGRNFSKDFKTDSTGLILNEEAVKVLGMKEPLKELLYRPKFKDNNIIGVTTFHILGVVNDFNFSTLHQKIGPLVIQLGSNTGSIAVRLGTGNIQKAIKNVQSLWNTIVPGQPFNYTFMDADFNNMYTSEQRTGKLFIAFAIFAILIGCLGLFGLITYAAEQRTKEIGLRKVLGASINSIVFLLSKDFTRLVFIASLIAFPIAWYAMHSWLQSFAYRVEIKWWIFIIAGLISLTIAFITVSVQAFKAAIINPAKSLKNE